MSLNISNDERPTSRTERSPGVCLPWDEVRENLPPINGDPELFRRIWSEVDQLAYLYIWYCLLAF